MFSRNKHNPFGNTILINSAIRILDRNFDACLRALHDAIDQNFIYGGKFPDLEAQFSELGFEIDMDIFDPTLDDPDNEIPDSHLIERVLLLGSYQDTESCSECYMFETIGPFVTPGSWARIYALTPGSYEYDAYGYRFDGTQAVPITLIQRFVDADNEPVDGSIMLVDNDDADHTVMLKASSEIIEKLLETNLSEEARELLLKWAAGEL